MRRAVHLAYASPHGHAVVDRGLHLPESSSEDPARCAAAGIPAEVAFAAKPALVAATVECAPDADVPARRVAGQAATRIE